MKPQTKATRVLVASGNQALATGDLIPASGYTMGVANGQLGLVSLTDAHANLDKNEFLGPTNNTAGTGVNTVSDVADVKFVVGTPASADISNMNSMTQGYSHKKFIESFPISANDRISFLGTAAVSRSRSAALLGAAVGGAGSFPVDAGTNYKLSVSFDSVRRDATHGTNTNSDTIYPYATTPASWTSIGITTDAERTDWIIQNLVYTTNVNSKYLKNSLPSGNKPVIAFALDLDGGGNGVAISAISAGTSIDFMVRNGQTLSYTADQAFVDTLTKLVADTAVTNSTEIGVVDLTAAAQAHDHLLLVALDEDRAVVEDREESVAVRLNVGPNEALYNSDSLNVDVIEVILGLNDGLTLSTMFKKEAKQHDWSPQWMGLTTNFIDTPNYFVESASYNTFIINHQTAQIVREGFTEEQQRVSMICVPSTNGVGEATTISGLNAVATPWLNSMPNITVDTDAAGTNLFV
ncbi:MAG: hypothetical protein MJH10_12060 [Epibacterium sp.]|nr:hypothetical protein [Epibacterium sp.]NQX74281.1 hypothetical protein [Epibacterium sp.]